MKKIIFKLDFTKIKNLESVKYIVMRIKRQATDWRKSCKIFQKELVFRGLPW